MRLCNMLNATDALASDLGGLGLSHCAHKCGEDPRDKRPAVHGIAGTVTPLRQKQPEECLTPRVQELTLEIAKLQQQIKRLTRRRKKLRALNPNSQAACEGFMARKAAEYFAIDERRRRMQSAEPLRGLPRPDAPASVAAADT